jgi:hypothetical protein
MTWNGDQILRTKTCGLTPGVQLTLLLAAIIVMVALVYPWPPGGVRAGQPREVHPGDGVSLARLLSPDRLAMDGTTLAGTFAVPGGSALVLLDLPTGQVQRLAYWPDPNAQYPDAYLSGRFVAWQHERGGEPPVRLHVYDRELQREVLVRYGYGKQMALKDDLLIWRDFDASSTYATLVAYDLRAQRQYSVTAPTSLAIMYPRICSREWIIYLYDVPLDVGLEPTWSALRAHNLNTGEEITLAERAFTGTSSGTGQQHDCDGQWATWFESNPRTSGLVQRVYDFATNTARELEISVPPAPHRARVSAGVVINSESGYDLTTGRAFSLPYGNLRQAIVSRDQIAWWTDSLADEPVRLYVAPILRGQ